MKIMKTKQKGVRILAVLLAVAITLTSMPITARAEEEISQITVENLDEIAEPTEFPAEGTMHIYVLKASSLGDDYAEDFEEAYLPVIVDQNKNVYAELDVLKSHLGMKVIATTGPWNEAVRTIKYHNSSLILQEGGTGAVYTMCHSNGNKNDASFFPYTAFDLANAPCMYKDKFYVPLDSFLQCTGTTAFYAGEDEMGKQDLYMIPPQRTVLDDLVNFNNDAYSYYAFNVQKDIGFSERNMINQYYSAEFLQYMKRFGSFFDAGAWSMAIGFDDRFFDNKYMDMYMKYALYASEEVLNAGWEHANSILDVAALVLDVTELNVSGGWEQVTLITNEKAQQLNKISETSGTLGNIGFGVGSVLKYWSICASLGGADQISVKGADLLFNNYSEFMNHQYLEDQNLQRAKTNIRSYEGKLGYDAIGRWVEEYTLSTGMSFAKILTNKLTKVSGILGIVGVASAIWSGGTDLLFGDILDSSESYMAAYLGQQYEYEVLPAVEKSITAYIKGEMSEEDVRSIIYHVMASCYAARYLGCMALEEQLIYYPQIRAEQQKINQGLVDLMATLQCSGIQMGMTQKDFYNLKYNEAIHYDNVYFNICQVQGRITYWDSGKPADNLEVWISDETGAVLTEFVTDKAGDFDISFPVEDVSIFDEGELKKQITFHIEEWWYPEILETVEIPVFKKCKVDGLWAGKKEETIKCYLEDANEEDGQVILNVRRIEIDADKDVVINFNMPLFFTEGSYQNYVLRSGQYRLGDTIERVVLEDGMVLETIFSLMYPDGTWAGEFMQLFAGSGISPGLEMDAMMNSDMHEAEEIYRYIEQYAAINGEYPTYEITKVNSQIDTIEPIMIQMTK